jgi:hypothetical protein
MFGRLMFQHARAVLVAVAELEKLGFTSYLLAVPEYNKQKLQGQVQEVKEVLEGFSYPYNRRIAGAHGNFSKKDYKEWLEQVEDLDLARALSRLAQLNQTKVYLFWKRSLSQTH